MDIFPDVSYNMRVSWNCSSLLAIEGCQIGGFNKKSGKTSSKSFFGCPFKRILRWNDSKTR